MYTTQSQLRKAFWEEHPECERMRKPGRQNNQVTDVRVTWVDWIDCLQKNGQISEELACRATL
jgi:hypothetical protein